MSDDQRCVITVLEFQSGRRLPFYDPDTCYLTCPMVCGDPDCALAAMGRMPKVVGDRMVKRAGELGAAAAEQRAHMVAGIFADSTLKEATP